MIRQHYLTELNKLIVAQKRFRESDFTISLNNEVNRYVLEVHYCYDLQYHFTASMSLIGDVVKTDVRITIVACPGTIFKSEKWTDILPDQLNDHIKTWLARLSNELASVPVQRQLEAQQKEIQTILKQLDDIPQEYFTKEEGEYVKSKLEELEQRLTKNLQETVTTKTEQREKAAALASDISILRENIEVLNKRGWLKALATRTFDWAKDPAHRKVITAGAQVAKEFLLQAGKNEPPS